MRAFYSDHFVLPLPEGHKFPMAKYSRLRERILAEGIVSPDDLHEAPLAAIDDLRLVHEPAYVDAVMTGTVPREIQRRIGFPWSPQMVERSRRSVGATIAAAHAALDDGVAANLAGGTHHAFADRGEGFCVFNDVAVAARVLQRDQLTRAASRSSISTCTRATAPPRSSAATRRCSRSRCTVTRTSRSRKKPAIWTCLSPTAPATTSTCRCCDRILHDVLNRHQPDFVFYLAGADPFEGDRLGRLKLTIDGLRRRDEIVMEACTRARLPVAISMSGGYANDIDAIVTIHANTIRVAGTAMAQHFRLLTEQQVHSLLPMPDLIAAMESALAKFSAREVLQPVRSVLTVGPTKAYFGLMPAYVPAPASLGAKLVTVFGENHKRDLPSHLATILLLDPETGALQAIMDGRYITEARTAAVSAVSTRFLGQARRIDPRDHRQRRAGAQPPRGVSAGPAVEAGADLVAEAAQPRAVRRGYELTRRCADRRRGYRRSRGARRRPDRAGHLVTDAGD